ncbi:unnamed protein product, partial [Heterosigma akashiwo]
FGFEKVEYGEKRERVREVFTNVASKYDLMNDAMSAGIHRLWKDDFVENIGLSALAAAGGDSPKVLDVAGGTGDIAFRILEQLQECWPDAAGAVPPGHPAGGRLAASADADADASAAAAAAAVTVFDINADMMEVGRARRALFRAPPPPAQVGPGRRGAAPLRRGHLRPVHGRVRPAQRDGQGPGAGRGAARAAARRPVHVPGVLAGGGAGRPAAVRPLLFPGDPAHGRGAGGGRRLLPVPGGEHPGLP